MYLLTHYVDVMLLLGCSFGYVRISGCGHLVATFHQDLCLNHLYNFDKIHYYDNLITTICLVCFAI